MPDQVVLVDSQDNEIGVMDKVEAHRGKGKLHRAVSVFLFNSQKELLIQQRSSQKIVGAGQWANTCCGNVHPGETYEECAKRRLAEELGITSVSLQKITKFEYHVQCNAFFSEHEIDTLYVGKYAGEVIPNPAEVAAYTWEKWENFVKRVEKKDATIVPWESFLIESFPSQFHLE